MVSIVNILLLIILLHYMVDMIVATMKVKDIVMPHLLENVLEWMKHRVNMKADTKVKTQRVNNTLDIIVLLVVGTMKEVVMVTPNNQDRLIMVLKVAHIEGLVLLLFLRLHLTLHPPLLRGTEQGQIQVLHHIPEREGVMKCHMVLEAIKVTTIHRHILRVLHVSTLRGMKMVMLLHRIIMEDTLMLPLRIFIPRRMDVKSILWRVMMRTRWFLLNANRKVVNLALPRILQTKLGQVPRHRLPLLLV